MRLNTLVPLVLVLALVMVAAAVASPPQQTDFDLTASALVGSATGISTGLPPATRTAQTKIDMETQAALTATSASVLETIAYRAPTRTAIAITRNPRVLSYTPYPVVLTATQVSIQSAPTAEDTLCQLVVDNDGGPLMRIDEGLRNAGIQSQVLFFTTTIQSLFESRQCEESYRETELFIFIDEVEASELNTSLASVLAVLSDVDAPDDTSRISASVRLIIYWDSPDIRGNIDTEYRNAIE
ncbi:MAG: hypothetical protein AAF653_19470, partial [Chloroflexota bacterium]